jgi:hypothetical protein
MRALAASLALLSLGLASCNANPLLKAAASDYAPLRVGSKWSYTSPDGTVTVQRAVTGSSFYQGLDAFSVDTSINAGPASTVYIAFQDGDELSYDTTLGWILYRRLPLVSSNKWTVPSSNPLVTQTVIVDGLEKVTVPLGAYEGCWRIRTHTDTYNPGSGLTSTAETLAWAAPDVGDVRYADLAPDGTITVTLELTGVTLP